jgi:3-oxosteroid 1-dehydrogenase
METDVVVVGSGFAGLATALFASAQGLDTVVVEKAAKVGGGSCHSYGILWVGTNHLERAAGIDDPPGEVAAYLKYIEGGQGDARRMDAFLSHSPAALESLTEAGVPLMLIKGLADHYDGRAPGSKKHGRSLQTPLFATPDLGEWQDKLLVPPSLPRGITCEELVTWGGITNKKEWQGQALEERLAKGMVGLGPGLVGHVLKELLRRGVPVRAGAGARRLLESKGRVTGIQDNEGRNIKARKGVVLAAGGYDSNPEMVRNFEGIPGWVSQFPESVTGDAMVMATEVGAATQVIRDKLDLFLGFSIPKKSRDEPAEVRLAGISEMFCPHTIVVNAAGRRFGDEGYFQGLVPTLRQYDVWNRRYENLPCFLVFDGQYSARFSFAGNEPGAEPPEWVARADSIAGLAAKLGVDADGLRQTIARFNGFVEAGADADFHRGEESWTLASGSLARGRSNPSLGTIKEPPYYGVRLHPSGCSSAGVLANETGQAVHVRGNPIAGLYVIGNAASRNEYGVGYQAGFTLAAGMTFGYLAVRHMKRVGAEKAA